MAPVDDCVGSGEPKGTTKTSHCVTLVLGSVQPNKAEVDVISEAVKPVGPGQAGKSSIITLSIYNLQPSSPPAGTCQAILTGPV